MATTCRRSWTGAGQHEGLRVGLLIEMFCYSVRKQVAAMMAVLGGLDMLVFSGGIGENDGQVRAGVDVETGLSAQEAANRQAQGEPNELRAALRVPAWRRVLAQFHDPLVYLLLGAVAVATRRRRRGR